MIACLSPNGLNSYTGEGPLTTLLVATIHGICSLERTGREWREGRRSLEDLHISSLMIEPSRGGIFAGAHLPRDASSGGGIYLSLDQGVTWEPRMGGLSTTNVFCVRSTMEDGRPVL
ncbi:MAG: glycosyl hydrolase, partial [Chloroflexi bacterium]|nr:glycosyl hydrolase [Chloroflexota bacterium]